MQSLGSGYTVATDRGYMYRVDAKDTDALGLSNAATAQESAIQEGPFSDQTVWDQLKTVYDPEIPGNIHPHCKLPSVDGPAIAPNLRAAFGRPIHCPSNPAPIRAAKTSHTLRSGYSLLPAQ